jgi:hypothetical protein
MPEQTLCGKPRRAAHQTQIGVGKWPSAALFGNLAAGAVGALRSATGPGRFFAIVAAIATVSGAPLPALTPWARGRRGHAGRPLIANM